MLWTQTATLLMALALPPAPQSDCLACHGQPGMTSGSGMSLYVEERGFSGSVHGAFGCEGCHTAATEVPHPDTMPPPDCSACHREAAAAVAEGVHQAFGAAACRGCHGPPHSVLSSSDPNAPVAKRHLAATCGACHSNPDFLSQHGIAFARPVEAYLRSAHARAVARGSAEAPSCSNCHGSHAIFRANDSRAGINRWNVPRTCGACHSAIQRMYEESVHGRAAARGAGGAPVCTDCHGEHAILAPAELDSPVSPSRVSTATCGRCHADERLAENYNLPLDKVPSFADSYHGLAVRAGSQSVANCASCHGVHNILPSSDPRSSIHADNLARTCGQCHPGAGERFALGPVHVLPGAATEHPVVAWIRRIYGVLIPLVVGVLFLHNAVDFLSKLIRPRHRPASDILVPRMNLHFRIAHWLTVASFPLLVLSGFALKYPEQWWAAPLVRWENGIDLRGGLHRIAGVVLLGSLLYHAVHLALSPRDRRILRHLLPGWQDVKDFWNMIRFNLGWLARRPQWGKFGYAEKIEYWAYMWGVLIMAATGLLLWFNDFTLRMFPKWVADAATALHFYEAVLATLAVVVWHFYMVMFDPDVYPMDRTWLTGKSSLEHLRQSRPGYAAELLRQQGQTGGGQSTDAQLQESPNEGQPPE